MLPRTLSVLSLQNISAWKVEYDLIPAEIANNQKILNTYHLSLSSLQQQLSDLINQKINHNVTKISDLQAQLNLIKLPRVIEQLEQQILSYDTQIAELSPKIKEMQENIERGDKQIHEINKLINIKEVQFNIAQTEDENQSAEADLDLLRSHLQPILLAINEKSQEKQLVQSRLISLKTEESVHTMIHYYHSPHRGHQHGYVDDEYRLLGDIVPGSYNQSRLRNIDELECQLADLAQDKANLIENKNIISLKMEELQSLINVLQASLNELSRQWRSFLQADIHLADSMEQFELEKRFARHIEDRMLNEDKLELLSNEIQQHQLAKNALHEQLELARKELDSSRKRIKIVYENTIEATLETQLNAQYTLGDQLSVERKQLQLKIDDYFPKIAEINDNIRSLQARHFLFQSHPFLIEVWNKPETLFNNLINSIEFEFQEYEKNHPANQSILVRLCLSETEEKIRKIQHRQSAQEGQDFSIQAEFQKKYYQACGFLIHSLNKLKAPDDNNFISCLGNILNKNVIDSVSANEEYNKIAFRESTVADLLQREILEYGEACRELRDLCSKDETTLSTAGRAILNLLDAEKNVPDMKFIITILRKTSALLRDPSHPMLLADYENLIKHNHNEESSSSKKMGGVLFMVLGAAAVTVGSVAKQFSWDVSNGSLTASIVAGSAAFLSGAGLFRSGMQKGLLQKMVNVRQAVGRVALSSQAHVAVLGDDSENEIAEVSVVTNTKYVKR